MQKNPFNATIHGENDRLLFKCRSCCTSTAPYQPVPSKPSKNISPCLTNAPGTSRHRGIHRWTTTPSFPKMITCNFSDNRPPENPLCSHFVLPRVRHRIHLPRVPYLHLAVPSAKQIKIQHVRSFLAIMCEAFLRVIYSCTQRSACKLSTAPKKSSVWS